MTFHRARLHPNLELKNLLQFLKYAFLGKDNTFLVVISSSLSVEYETALINVLKACKGAIGWNIAEIQGINPLICSHHIYIDDDTKASREPQRRLNPKLKEVVK